MEYWDKDKEIKIKKQTQLSKINQKSSLEF